MNKFNKRCCMLLVILMTAFIFASAVPAVTQAAGVKLKMYNMWATWCKPCIGELPDLGEISRKYQGVVELIGMQLDATDKYGNPNESGIQKAKELFATHNCTYANRAFGEDTYWMLDGVDAVPTTIFLDAKGKEVERIVGTRDFRGWAAIIEEILAGLPDDPGILRGDVNNDGDVNHEDLQRLVDYFVSETKPASMANADADGSGKVDHDDLEALIALILDQ